MKNICVIFEEWHLPDGNYPPFHKEQKVNLSFYLNEYEWKITDEGNCFFNQIKHCEYEFCGEIIGNYYTINQESILIIVDTGTLRFYVELDQYKGESLIGKYVYGKGELLLDYYIWVGYLKEYKDPPDIFYNFKVDRIRKIKIPEKFIYRHERGFSAPTSLSVDDYDYDDMIEINKMEDRNEGVMFFLVDLKPIDDQVPKTYR